MSTADGGRLTTHVLDTAAGTAGGRHGDLAVQRSTAIRATS